MYMKYVLPGVSLLIIGALSSPEQSALAVFVNLISGELTYIEADSCAETRYTYGQAFVDPGQGHVHSAINRGTAPTVFVATFYDAPAEGALLIPAQPADC